MINYKDNQQTTVLSNEKGVTIFEMIISIAVGSIVLMMLMQMLAMNITARQHFDYENRMINESYSITERIRSNIFDLQTQRIEVDDTSDPTKTIITIYHDYDISVTTENVVTRVPNEITNVIIYDKTAETLSYVDELGNSNLLHSSSLRVKLGTNITFEQADPTTCVVGYDIYDPTFDICGQGILRLELVLFFVLNNGSPLSEQTYTSTIII